MVNIQDRNVLAPGMTLRILDGPQSSSGRFLDFGLYCDSSLEPTGLQMVAIACTLSPASFKVTEFKKRTWINFGGKVAGNIFSYFSHLFYVCNLSHIARSWFGYPCLFISFIQVGVEIRDELQLISPTKVRDDISQEVSTRNGTEKREYRALSAIFWPRHPFHVPQVQ